MIGSDKYPSFILGDEDGYWYVRKDSEHVVYICIDICLLVWYNGILVLMSYGYSQRMQMQSM